jgi:WXG100 family type VII secretion target
MIEGTLLVTPETLQEKSRTFSSLAVQVKALHDDMIQRVNGLTSAWEGTAADAYRTKFAALQTSMDTINRMIMEHSTDLDTMAQTYIDAENQATSAVDSLPASSL